MLSKADFEQFISLYLCGHRSHQAQMLIWPPAGCFKITCSFGLDFRFMSSTGPLLAFQELKHSSPEHLASLAKGLGFLRRISQTSLRSFFFISLLNFLKHTSWLYRIRGQGSRLNNQHYMFAPPPFSFFACVSPVVEMIFSQYWYVSTGCRPADRN